MGRRNKRLLFWGNREVGVLSHYLTPKSSLCCFQASAISLFHGYRTSVGRSVNLLFTWIHFIIKRMYLLCGFDLAFTFAVVVRIQN